MRIEFFDVAMISNMNLDLNYHTNASAGDGLRIEYMEVSKTSAPGVTGVRSTC